MLVRHASIVAGSSGSVLWFTDILDDLAGLFDGRNCVQTNLKDGMKKVVIINEGAGDAVALLGEIRGKTFHVKNDFIYLVPYSVVRMRGVRT